MRIRVAATSEPHLKFKAGKGAALSAQFESQVFVQAPKPTPHFVEVRTPHASRLLICPSSKNSPSRRLAYCLLRNTLATSQS